MQLDYDVIVVGGSLVGASLALALGQAGKRVALLEARPPQLDQLTEGWDSRIYAISPANQRFLASLNAWPGEERIGPVSVMDVRGDGSGKIAFSAQDAGADVLAWIIESRWLLAALWQALPAHDVDCLLGQPASELSVHPHYASLSLADGRTLRTALVVGADGANSWVRQQASLPVSIKPYGQSGVVANFQCEHPHGQVARQWFTGESILAWLPMAGQRMSMVWATSQPKALLQLSPEQLCQQVATAGQHTLGQLELITPAAAFELRLMQPEAVISPRLALVGDAAHTVHPLAGQGVNLGFQDAAVLAALLSKAPDAGDWLTLRRYQRQRYEAVKLMQHTCDGLHQLFHAKLPGLPWLRNLGLNLSNQLGPLKRQLARHAIGV